MGNNSSVHLSVLFVSLLLALLSLFALPVYSTPRRALLHHQTTAKKTGFRVTLHHVDHGKNLTKLERLQRGIKRGSHRLQRLNAMVLAANSDSSSSSSVFESPIRAGNGEFLMQLSIGTPPNAYSAIMDTGSDLIWTQCLPCETCFDQPTPIFDPRNSSSFSKLSCSSQLCEALPQSTCSDSCDYFYGYGDYSSTQGVLASETFSFGDGDEKVSVNGIGFGCGGDNEGDGFSQGSGLVGLGRGPLSLVSQLKEPKFSYCLTAMDDTKTSSLLVGPLASVNTTHSGAKVTTPLIENPSQPSFYYLSLEGISVGGSLLPIEKDTFALKKDGSGGLIIDSGTTITYLEKKAFDIVKKEFTSQINLPVDKSGSQGLDLCFNLPKYSTSVEVPKLSFHFKNDAVLELPPENYILSDRTLGVLCLAMGSSSGMSIFGNIQQQNFLVVHDLSEGTMSFVPTQCNQL